MVVVVTDMDMATVMVASTDIKDTVEVHTEVLIFIINNKYFIQLKHYFIIIINL